MGFSVGTVQPLTDATVLNQTLLFRLGCGASVLFAATQHRHSLTSDRHPIRFFEVSKGLKLPAPIRCRNRKQDGITDANSWSVQALNDRAVDGEAGTPKCFSARPSDQTVLHEGEDLKLFTYLSPEPLVDGILGPFEQLGIPVRAVIESDGWDSTQDVVRPKAVSQICR